MDRQLRVIARQVRIMNGGPVQQRAVLLQRQVVGNRDRLAMRHQKALVGPLQRRPAAHLGRQPGTVQINSGIATVAVAHGIGRPMAFMAAPAQLGRLQTFADEAIHRPGVDKLLRLPVPAGGLAVTLGNVNSAYRQTLRQRGPVFGLAGLHCAQAGVVRHVEQGLLHQAGHQAWVGPLRQHGGGAMGCGAAKGQGLFAQAVVGALRGRQEAIGIGASPGLDAGVQVQRATLAAQGHQRQAADTDRQVQQHIARGQPGRQLRLKVVLGQALHGQIHTHMLGLFNPIFAGGNEADLPRFYC